MKKVSTSQLDISSFFFSTPLDRSIDHSMKPFDLNQGVDGSMGQKVKGSKGCQLNKGKDKERGRGVMSCGSFLLLGRTLLPFCHFSFSLYRKNRRLAMGRFD